MPNVDHDAVESLRSTRTGKTRARKTLYITVDPIVTPATEADLGYFDLDALGLTGTKPEIDKVVALYGASYEIIPTPQSVEKYRRS